MNESGKLKHRVHLMAFRRGESAEGDVLVAHVVTRKQRVWKDYRKLTRYVHSLPAADAGYVGWAVEEPYWRKHGLAGRTNPGGA